MWTEQFRVGGTISKEVGRRNSFHKFMEIDGKGNKSRAITWSGRSPTGGGMGARICLFHYGPRLPRFRYLRSRLAEEYVETSIPQSNLPMNINAKGDSRPT